MKKPKTRSWSSVKKATKKGKKKGKLTKEDRKTLNESVVSILERQLVEDGTIPAWVREFKFCPSRKWRLDFAWPELKIGVEAHGGVWTGGRHVSGTGFTNDREKINWGIEDGWRILEFETRSIKSGEAVAQLKRVINNVL